MSRRNLRCIGGKRDSIGLLRLPWLGRDSRNRSDPPVWGTDLGVRYRQWRHCWDRWNAVDDETEETKKKRWESEICLTKCGSFFLSFLGKGIWFRCLRRNSTPLPLTNFTIPVKLLLVNHHFFLSCSKFYRVFLFLSLLIFIENSYINLTC